MLWKGSIIHQCVTLLNQYCIAAQSLPFLTKTKVLNSVQVRMMACAEECSGSLDTCTTLVMRNTIRPASV